MTTSILITGGAGFVGTNLCRHLCAQGGYRVSVLDNETMGNRSDLADLDVTFVHGDVRDTEVLARVVPGQDVIVHLAAHTRVVESASDPVGNFDVNARGSLALLEAARRHGVAQVVAASTGGAILGEAPVPIHEDMPARPLSPYGASKLAMEGYLSAYAGSYGMTTCALRFSNIYGPYSYHKGSVVATYMRALVKDEPLTVYGDGSQVRDYLYVGDLVAGIARAITARAQGVYQLGRGEGTRLDDLIAVLKDATGRPAARVVHEPARAGEVHTTYCDIAKAQRAFGYAVPTDLGDGLRRTWAWFSGDV